MIMAMLCWIFIVSKTLVISFILYSLAMRLLILCGSGGFAEPTLTEEETRLCEGFLTYDECWQASQGMANNKRLGLDGLPKDFYHHFFSLFGHHFVEMINWCFILGELLESPRTSIITCFCKIKDR